MNKPLVIAGAGVVVVVAAIVANFVLWRQEVNEGPPPAVAARPLQPPARVEAPARPAARTETPAPATPSAASPAPPPATAPAPPAPATAPTPPTPAPGSVAKPQQQPLSPSFDVVRVNPKGDAVIAGRAEPGSTVTVFDGGKAVGEARADGRGEWVFVPDKPLPPGSRQLSLESVTTGKPRALSENVVVLVVPEKDKDIAGQPATGGTQALALRVPREGIGGSTVLQRPTPAPVEKPAAAPPSPSPAPLAKAMPAPVPVPKQAGNALSIDVVDYGESGHLTIGGHAAAGTLVQLYLSNRFAGRAQADSEGVWRISPDGVVAPGLYNLRVDQIGVDGKVMARVETPFSRAEAPMLDLKPGTVVVVQPGNSLWRLARRTYGSGIQYAVIYEANRDQIRDADLIYPGQVFSLPTTN